jgi:hypothetical protein
MFQRAVARVLILLLFLPGTWAAHAHAGTSAHDPSGLDRLPHFHLRFFNLSRQQDPSDQNCHFRKCHEGKTFTGSKPTADHDEDAIYLPVSVLLGWCSNPPVDLASPTGLVMLAGTIYVQDAGLVTIPSPELLLAAFHWQPCLIRVRFPVLLI